MEILNSFFLVMMLMKEEVKTINWILPMQKKGFIKAMAIPDIGENAQTGNYGIIWNVL